MFKLAYIVNQRIPTEKAYGIQIAKMCEAFADSGLDVMLVAPRRGRGVVPDFFDHYSVRRNFRIYHLASPDFYWPGRLDFFAFWIKNFFSAWVLARYAIKSETDIIYSRDELPLFLISLFKPKLKIVFEAHKFSKNKTLFYKRFKKAGTKIVAISNGLANEFLKLGFSPARIEIAPDGVDGEMLLETEQRSITKISARELLGWPSDSKIAVYTGSLYEWKGVYTMADAAKLLPEVNFLIVGGGQGEMQFREYVKKSNIKNLKMTGYISDGGKLRLYRCAADVFLLPNSAKEKLSESYTSPLKLFEYMASLRPVVASDISSIREILNENNAILVKPDSPEKLADGIRLSFNTSDAVLGLARKAFEDVRSFTWSRRSGSILKFIY